MCFFTCSPRPPTLSQRHMVLHVWAYLRRGYIFQVSSKSIQGFRSPRGSKFGLSHSLLQPLVLPYKPWVVQAVIKQRRNSSHRIRTQISHHKRQACMIKTNTDGHEVNRTAATHRQLYQQNSSTQITLTLKFRLY